MRRQVQHPAEERSGILAGGNWIIDRVKIVDRYPREDGLACIVEESRSNGGSPYNLLKDLAKLQAPFPLEAAGLVGEDEPGAFILDDCRAHGIVTAQLQRTPAAPTSYTDVMTVRGTGRRTFFHQPGANRLLDTGHFSLRDSHARIFHLGYLLLLDRLDEIRPDGSTGAAALLHEARALGFRTSADLVSEETDRVRAVVTPSLPAIDYLFLNELEASTVTNVSTIEDGIVDAVALSEAAARLIAAGVRQLVCIHHPGGVLARDARGGEWRQGSVNIPGEKMIGALGAGDAFAAGVLFGVHEQWDTQRSLRLGICAAGASLAHQNSSESVLPWADCLRLGQTQGFRS